MVEEKEKEKVENKDCGISLMSRAKGANGPIESKQ